MHRLDVPLSVDHPDPVRVAAGEPPVGLGDRALELEPLGLEAIVPDAARRGALRLDRQQGRDVGPQATRRELAHGDRDLDAEPARRALVRGGRVAEPVADDVAASLRELGVIK